MPSLSPGSAARVVFSIPGQARPFKLHSKIVRTEKEGAGVQFDEMAAYSRQTLDEVLSGRGDGGWLSGSTSKIEAYLGMTILSPNNDQNHWSTSTTL